MSQEYTTTNSATSETEPLKNKSDSNHNRSNIATNSTETPVKVSEISLDPISLEDETIIGEDTKVLSNLTEDIVSQVDSLYEQASSAKEEEEYDEEDEKEKDEIRKMFGEDYDYIEEKETRPHEEKTVIEDTDIYANIMKVKNDKKARGDKKKKDCFKNSDNESFIVRAILGNRANFSIQIRIEDISFFVPEDVTVHEDTTNMLLNFTWRSTKARFNNSLSLMLTQISNYYLVTGVKLKLMKCDEMTDWIKNEVLIPKRKDKYGQLELAADLDDEVTVLISNINFLKIYYDEAEVSGPSTVDIENELFQMEITVAITAFFTVIVIGGVSIVIYFVIVRRKRRLFDFKNKKICPL
ncbi:unnamed protein product [Acanthoscelides obtectus]|nr:unnamed protein product [Acanthoscelides obtectus]CAK1629366.1 hypothetical protein AOBTE_LOCUS5704 [Acanthoscelides obtectus]